MSTSTRPSLRAPVATFQSALLTSLRIYSPARDWCKWSYESFDETPYHPRVAAKVVGLAFLNAVTAWEQFLEDVFLRYLSGAASPSGYQPALRLGPCHGTAHASQVLEMAGAREGSLRTGRWSDYGWVVATSHVFFGRGEPFTLISPRWRERLSDATALRNRVAHSSDRARRRFKPVAAKFLGLATTAPLPRGMSPGRLLVEGDPRRAFDATWLNKCEHTWGDLFEAYISMYSETSSQLVPV